MIYGLNAESSSSREDTSHAANSLGFIKVPTSQIVVVNKTARFQCQPADQNAIVLWHIDGEVISLGNRPSSVSFEETFSNGTVDNLLLTALPIYNGSEIECQAFITDDPTMLVISPPAVLQGKNIAKL